MQVFAPSPKASLMQYVVLDAGNEGTEKSASGLQELPFLQLKRFTHYTEILK